jgi:hypothetical protein
MKPSQLTQTSTSSLTVVASMYQFLIEYPQFAEQPIVWTIDRSGHVKASAPYLHPDSERIVADLATALHGEVRTSRIEPSNGSETVDLICFGVEYDGVPWSVHGYLPVVAAPKLAAVSLVRAA